MKKSISIVIPVYNEEKTIIPVLDLIRSLELSWTKDIIVVNDGSTDKTSSLLKKYTSKFKEIKHIRHPKNQGKGAAIKTAIENSQSDYIIIQDADLEYDPNDIERMINFYSGKDKEVIYGTRLAAPPVLFGKNRTPLLLHYFGNKFLSLFTSLIYGSWLSDMETGYKLFPRKAMTDIHLRAKGFELEPEITAKLLKNGYMIREIPIITKPRGYEEGKKLNTWRDGYKALTTLIKYRFRD